MKLVSHVPCTVLSPQSWLDGSFEAETIPGGKNLIHKNRQKQISNKAAMNSEGQIQLIIGPMFSGKSSELQRMVRRFEISKRSCMVINYAMDCRYSEEDVVATHDK